jgi:LPS sulfotransferase NodH
MPLRYDLVGPAHDRAGREAPPVRWSYVLCSMPRSGSTLLAEGLHRTGRLGTPVEYLDDSAALPQLRRRWGCGSLAAYLEELHRRRVSDDGVLGAKVHWFQLAALADGLGLEPAAALARAFPRARLVWVRRRDRDAQAVSWVVADQTGRWARGPGHRPRAAPVGEPVYDFAAIAARRAELDAGEASWAALLRAAGAPVHEVVYEDLARDYAGQVAGTAAFLGVDTVAHEVPPPRLRPQAGGRSAAFVDRFRRERNSQGAVPGGR